MIMAFSLDPLAFLVGFSAVIVLTLLLQNKS